MNNTSVEITAGLGGFLVVFALGLAVWLLGRDLTRRLRRMRLREEERLEQVRREDAAGRQVQEREQGQGQHVGRPRREGEPAVAPEERDPIA